MSKMNTDSLRTPFFPNRSPSQDRVKISSRKIERNDSTRKNELDSISKNHTKVSINNKIKDFSRFKKVVDNAEEIERSDYLMSLKNKINRGEYNVDPEKIAEKMILNEF